MSRSARPVRRIRTLRIARGQSIGEAARLLDTTETHLSHIERGERRPGAELARRLESYYGELIADLLAVVDDDVPVAALRPFLDVLGTLVRKQVRRELRRASTQEDAA
jgi:transcriptional regulator with XRE-family HTH domain